MLLYVVIYAISVAAQVFLNYKRYVAILKWLTLVLLELSFLVLRNDVADQYYLENKTCDRESISLEPCLQSSGTAWRRFGDKIGLAVRSWPMALPNLLPGRQMNGGHNVFARRGIDWSEGRSGPISQAS